jgi:hypothetical protein
MGSFISRSEAHLNMLFEIGKVALLANGDSAMEAALLF